MSDPISPPDHSAQAGSGPDSRPAETERPRPVLVVVLLPFVVAYDGVRAAVAGVRRLARRLFGRLVSWMAAALRTVLSLLDRVVAWPLRILTAVASVARRLLAAPLRGLSRLAALALAVLAAPIRAVQRILVAFSAVLLPPLRALVRFLKAGWVASWRTAERLLRRFWRRVVAVVRIAVSPLTTLWRLFTGLGRRVRRWFGRHVGHPARAGLALLRDRVGRPFRAARGALARARAGVRAHLRGVRDSLGLRRGSGDS